MNKQGFTFVEILAVLIIMVLLVGLSYRALHKPSEEIEDLPEASEVNEEAEKLSVISYGKAIETSAVMYLTINPVASVRISVDGAKISNCHVDATSEAHTNSKSSCTTPDAKVVMYSGESIKCQSVTFNQDNGVLIITGCHVGDSTNTYNWHSVTGITKD